MKITTTTKPQSNNNIVRNWHIIDIKGKVLGRTSPTISKLLQGKHKSNYVPYLDLGDNVVIINASQVKITGRKTSQKTYTHYSGFPGGLKVLKLQDLLKTNPEKVVYNAVSGMLPKNKFRSDRLRRLFIFSDSNHKFNDKFTSK